MMKIGILTLPFTTNYGGILQAYALCTILEKLGHDVKVFHNNYRPRFSCGIHRCLLVYGYRIMRYVFSGGKNVVLKEKKLREQYSIIKRNLDEFVRCHINLYFISSIKSINLKEFDAIIVGSDQIWRPQYVKDMWNSSIEDAFLYFAKGERIKKISYAASLGNDQWCINECVTAKIKEIIKEYDGVTVRETSALKLCDTILDVNAQIVLDPTLLLKKEDYDILCDNSVSKFNHHFLLCYILDMNEEKQSLIDKVSKEKKLKIINIYKKWSDVSKPINERILPPVETWINAFKTADFIVTDSFHACVFSIIYRKPFVAIGNTERGITRFESLLHMLELDKNLLRNVNQYDSTQAYTIGERTNVLLNKRREESMAFLKSVLL